MTAVTSTMMPGAAAGMSWATFLRPLLASVSNPPAHADIGARVSAIMMALPDVQPHHLTPLRQREAMRRFRYWPTPPELLEIFAADLAHERDLAERRAALPAPEPDRPIRTMEEILQAKATIAAAKAELAKGDAAPGEQRKVRPSYLSNGLLLAHYERLAAEGNTGAALRADALRAKMEGEGQA